jgi:hypothetical protein
MSTKKSPKPMTLLRKTKKNLSKTAKYVLGIQPQPTKESSDEMTHGQTYNTANFIPAKSFKYNSPNTTDEVFEKTREKAFGVAMNYPRIKESLLQKKPAELKEIYVKYNDIYPKVLDFIQTETDKHNVEIGPSESNVKRAEKIAIAIALKPKKSLHSSTRRNKPKHNISHKASASKSASPKEPKPTMGQLMKSIQNKPVEEKKVELTTDDLVSMIHKAQVELREQELASMRSNKRVIM